VYVTERTFTYINRSERHVGTQGGGMDQAVSLLAHKGCALHVRFDRPQVCVCMYVYIYMRTCGPLSQLSGT